MVEAQAVDRVHRMGQTKDVVITRYLIRNSIEFVSVCLYKLAMMAPFNDDAEPNISADDETLAVRPRCARGQVETDPPVPILCRGQQTREGRTEMPGKRCYTAAVGTFLGSSLLMITQKLLKALR